MASQCRGKQYMHANGKTAWPELVGVPGVAAAATIESENRSVRAVILLENSGGTTDFRCDRVRVRVNFLGIVTMIPIVG